MNSIARNVASTGARFGSAGHGQLGRSLVWLGKAWFYFMASTEEWPG